MDFSKFSDEQLDIVGKVIQSAERRGLNPDFILPLVMAESGFNPSASSGKAYGVMQLMPKTAEGLKVDPKDINQNIEGGMTLLEMFSRDPRIGRDPTKLIAAYNAGPDNKFLSTGKLEDLPDETVKHLSKIADFSGGELAVPYTADVKPPEPKPKVTDVAEGEEIVPASEGDYRKQQAAMAGAAMGAGLGAATDVKRAIMGGPPSLNPAESAGAKWAAKTGYGQGEGTVREVSERYKKFAPQPLGNQIESKSMGAAARKLPVVPGTTASLSINAVAPELPAASPLQRATGAVKQVGNVMNRFPIAANTLAGAGAGFQGQDAYERYQRGDYPGAAIAGAGALGSLASMIPTPMTKAVGTGVSIASPAALMVLDKMRQQTAAGQKPPAPQP